MAEYNPPNEILPIFNPENYFWEDISPLTRGLADQRYLRKAGGVATGVMSFTQGIALNDGAALSPALSFLSNTTTGIYRSGADQLSISSAGVEVFRSTPTSNQSFSRLLIQDGTVSAPSLALHSQTNTGIFRGTTGSGTQISFAVAGVNRLDISGAFVRCNGNFYSLLNGSASAPAFSFTNSTNSGMYRSGSGSVAFSVNGVQKLNIASLLTTSNNPLDMTNNAVQNAPQVGNAAGNLEVRMNSTGAGGTLTLTGGTGLLAATAGGSSGQHLVLTINGTQYKIKLENP